MGKRWSIEEDLLVCEYYLKTKSNVKVSFDELFNIFVNRGYNRSKLTIKDRYYNFKYIDIGQGLSHVSKQQKHIFGLLNIKR